MAIASPDLTKERRDLLTRDIEQLLISRFSGGLA